MKALNTAGLALLARAEAGEAIPRVQLVHLATDVPQRWAVCGRKLVWGGFDWAPRDILVADVEDGVQAANDLMLTLPGVTPAEMALAFTDLDGVAVTLYEALVDPDDGTVADAVLAWTGFADVPGIQDGAEAVVIVRCMHVGNAALRPKPSLYTDDEQRRLYPGDTSLDFDTATDGVGVVWPAASYFKQG